MLDLDAIRRRAGLAPPANPANPQTACSSVAALAGLADRLREERQAVAERLSEAINRACLVRGDTEENRLGLLAECLALPLHLQIDMAEHFEEVRAILIAAGRPGCGLAPFTPGDDDA